MRLSLVTRVLEALGWNVWDPTEVNAEWAVARSEDATKVDLALFANSFAPSVLIEVKAVGKLSANLSAVERQVRDYNRDNTALFSVITDGQEWRLYYSQTGGEFAQKCFKVVDLLHGDLLEVERALTTFLSKAAIDIGSAKVEAEKYLQLSKRQRAMDDCLSEARRRVLEPPYPALPDSLVSLVKGKGFSLSHEEVMEHIAATGERNRSYEVAATTTQATAPAPSSFPVVGGTDFRELLPDNPGDLRFTRVLEASLAGQTATRWNELLGVGVRTAIRQGVAPEDLGRFGIKLRRGNYGDKGFARIPGTEFSMQNVDAGKAARSVVLIARKLRVPLRVKVQWGGDSPFAGQVGLLQWNP